MEDPIAFDLWVAVNPDMKPQATLLLQKANPNASRLTILQSVTKSALDHAFVPLVQMRGWKDVQAWRAEAEKVGAARVYQAGYGPTNDPRLQSCAEHSLFHAGSLGCPVDRGWHLE